MPSASWLAVALLAACSIPGELRAVGGTVDGLAGAGLVLQLNGGDDLAVEAGATAFQLEALVQQGKPYTVTVSSQPTSPSQTCTIAKGSGTAGNANVTDVAITCVTNLYAVRGAIQGLAGTGLVLQLSSADDLAVDPDAATFAFPHPRNSGDGYVVTVRTQPTSPSQTCTVANGAGTIGSADVEDVTVSCTTNSYAVRGSVTGLKGSGLVLQLNGEHDLNVNTAASTFAFMEGVSSGATYTVAVFTQPTGPTQKCTVTNASGIVAGQEIADIQVICATVNFLYAIDFNGSGAVLAYSIDPFTGGLTQVGSALPAGVEPCGIVADPRGRAVYVVNFGGDISAYTADAATGAIASTGRFPVRATLVADPIAIAMDAEGRYLYTANSETQDVSEFWVLTGGELQASFGPFGQGGLHENNGIPVIGPPEFVAVDPLGRFLYETIFGSTSTQTLAVYAISNAGEITPTGPVSGDGPGVIAFDPLGRFAFIADSETNRVTSFSIDSITGVLTQISGQLLAAGTHAGSIAVDPAGKFLYAVSAATNDATVFSVASAGVLAQVDGSPFPVGVAPADIKIEPTGRYAYVATAEGVSAYAIDSTSGGLRQLIGSPFGAGTRPSRLAITAKR
jgi:6-phosphogluconolactonase (cycloisomerase 2 family)